MTKTILVVLGMAIAFGSGLFFRTTTTAQQSPVNMTQGSVSQNKITEPLKLGAFSLSISVKDLEKSRQFYENLGFRVTSGDAKKNLYIMQSGSTVIGLFHGMFENHILTFNPGWDQNGKNIERFDDIRSIQKHLVMKGITIQPAVDEKSTGPASFMFKDPDGNVILIDQHR